MIDRYTALQRKQLATQSYSDTQECYLLVYAPGRHTMLEASLRNQLHRKFRLVTRLEGELTEAVDGVLLVAEDAAWMSTALSCFADALREGADLAVCDAVFGFEGKTTLYQRRGNPEENQEGYAAVRCAAVSRELLLRCRAAAHSQEDVEELLELAARLCSHRTSIPLVLVHYFRELCPEDAFSRAGKRMLLLSHVLDMTGAPIVLVSAVPVLRAMGYEVVVLGPEDGGAVELFLNAGASVITRENCTTSSELWWLALCADFVLANTIVETRVIKALNGVPVPVLWWLHDAFAGYPYLSHMIPKTVASNVRIYAVGKHAAAAMHSVRPELAIRPLIYGLPDYAQEDFVFTDLGYNRGRLLFATVGSFEPRKGQDVFCQAIRMLAPAVREKANFLFVGKAADREMLEAVRALTGEAPENVFYCPRLTRDEIKSLMKQVTCLVCASRDDPMPTFVTEGLIFGKPSIVSEHTGTAGLITEGVDGFVYPDDDPAALAQRLTWAIEHPADLAAMHDACRKLYETCYSKQAFAEALTAAVKELTA